MNTTSSAPFGFPALVGGQPLYLTGEDRLKLTVRNSAAAVTVRLTGRFLPVPCDGDSAPPRVQAFSQEWTPATDRSSSSVLLPLGEGWLLDASILASAGTPAIGQCFAVLSLVRGDAGATLDLSTLAAGYVTALQRASYPFGAIGSSLAGAGALRSITGTQPAAGDEISETVPDGALWELLAVSAALTTDATVANRTPDLALDDGANGLTRAGLSVDQAASLTDTWRWAQGAQPIATLDTNGNTSWLPIGVRLGAGFRIQTVTANLQAGDQWAAPQLLVREWIAGA